MEDQWLKRWNDRYSEAEFAYGVEPNEYLKLKLEGLKPGKILFPADGEGRNSVYAAVKGWQSYAFDISLEGRKKALHLAEQQGVKMGYKIGNLPELGYQADQFDAIALIFAHFPAAIKSAYHQFLSKLLKRGGFLIFEAFSKNHLSFKEQNPNVGGPSNLDDLFSIDELKADFKDFSFLSLEEKTIELNEGIHHRGTGSVIRFVAEKN